MQSHPIRVLLIDDDEDDYIVVRDLLSDISSIEFILKWVSDYGAALDAILSSEFDVCLLDYRLRGRNGLELMQEVVSRGAMTPIVFLTGHGGYDQDLEAMSKGAAYWLTKSELNATLLERSIRYAMERQRKRVELIKAKRVIQALSECNHAVIHMEDELELLRAICRIVVDVGGYRMAWVGYAEEDRDQTVTPVAKYGYEKGYLDSVKVTWQDAERGRGPTGTCIRTGFPGIIHSVGNQTKFAPWKVEALKRGYASVIGLPLLLNGRTLGALTIYSSETDAFDTEEVEFLVKLSGNLSYGIGFLRLRKARMQAEESLKQANLDLERRVEERTAELVKVNAELTREAEERKRTEEALKEGERKFRAIFDQTFQFMGLLTIDGRLIEANRTALQSIGVQGADVIGKPFWETPWWKHSTELQEMLRAAVKKAAAGEFVRFKAAYPSADGSLHCMDFSLKPVMDEAGGIVFLIPEARDINERKRAEEALRDSETRLRAIADSARDAILMIDPEGRITFWNPAAERILGYTREEAGGQNLHRLLAPQRYHAAHEAAFSSFVATGRGEATGKTLELVVRRKDGKEIPVELSLSSVFMNGWQAVGLLRDITERKQAEEALKESKERLANIIDFLPDATFVINNEGEVIAWNKAMEEMTGVNASDMLGKCNYEYALPFYGERRLILIDLVRDPQEETLSKYTRVAKRASEIEGDAYMPALRAGKTYLYGTASVLRDSSGNIVGAIESIRDITERKLAEDALRESEERFSRFFRASSTGTSITSLSDGQFVDINDAHLAFLGYTRDEVIGQNPLNLGIWANPEERVKMVEILQRQGRILDFETQFRRKSGEIRDVRLSAAVIEVAGQQYILGLTHDITESKRAKEEKEKLEAQLFQAQKMESVGRLAGGVAHDFNNMLGVIIGMTEMALNKGVSTGELQHNLQEILKAGLRSSDLTRQLLAFASKQIAVPKILDLNDTISSMLKMLRRLIGEDIDLLWIPELDLWQVKIDPSQVDQILANLAVNSRDAISGVGVISMRTENVVIDDSNRAETPECIRGEYVLLTVSDTGAGMSQEVRGKVFEPFFTTKELGKGTGLGLSTVYGIVKQNDGFVYVASEPGKGTTFKIYLPRFESETAEVPSEEADGKPPTGAETILLVEDDEAILNLSRMILEELGYTVLATPAPGHAIHLVEDHPGDIHLLITDVVMPGMNGRELAEKLSAIRPNLKCLYMSGYTADLIAHRGILDEGVNFIQKPFGSDVLAAKVRQVLDHLE
jgi:PAS domain S-box-containing protein